MVRMTPTNPGTTYTAVRSSGLYQIVGSSRIGSVLPPDGADSRGSFSSADLARTSDAAVLVALATVCGSEPSTTSCRVLVRPRERSEA
jgi:hypothetical protein